MAYSQQAHEVRQRIAAAPVEKWLKDEAMNDLERLTQAASADIKALHDQYSQRQAEQDQHITELQREDVPAEVRAYRGPNDFELRMIAVQNSGGHLSAVRPLYKFLKGESE